MFKLLKIKLCVAVCFALLLGGCAGDDQSSGNIFQVTLNGGAGTATLTSEFSNRTFIIIPFSASDELDLDCDDGNTAEKCQPANYALSLALEGQSASKLADLPEISPKTNQPSASPNPRVEFEKERWQQSYQAIKHRLQTAGPISPPAPKFGPSFSFSSTITIPSPFEGEKNTMITGEKLADNDDAAIYIDSRDSGSFSSATAEDLLDQYSSVALPRLETMYGSPTDINNDGGVIIFLSSLLPEGVIGFFRPVDLLANGFDPSTTSAEREIVFVRIPSTGTISPLLLATLGHETCHLINFGVKSVPAINSGNFVFEELWLEEAKCHYSEDRLGYGGGDTFKVAGEFLNNVNLASVAGFVDDSLQGPSATNDSLARRGGGMLLLAYAAEQAGGFTYSTASAGNVTGGGVNLLRLLNTSSLVGAPNLEQAAGRSFRDLYEDWVAALYVDGTGLTTDDRFNFVDEQIDSFTNQPRGFNLRGQRAINGEANNIESLNGPSILTTITSLPTSLSNSFFWTGTNFVAFQLTGQNSVTLQYSTVANSNPGMTIIAIP